MAEQGYLLSAEDIRRLSRTNRRVEQAASLNQLPATVRRPPSNDNVLVVRVSSATIGINGYPGFIQDFDPSTFTYTDFAPCWVVGLDSDPTTTFYLGRLCGLADDGSGTNDIPMLQVAGGSTAFATYTNSGIVSLSQQFLGAGMKFVDKLGLGALGSSSLYGFESWSYTSGSSNSASQVFGTNKGSGEHTSAKLFYLNSAYSPSTQTTVGTGGTSDLFSTGYVYATQDFVAGPCTAITPPTGQPTRNVGDGLGTFPAGSTGCTYNITCVTSFGETTQGPTSGSTSGFTITDSITVDWSGAPTNRPNDCIGFNLYRNRYYASGMSVTTEFAGFASGGSTTSFQDTGSIPAVQSPPLSDSSLGSASTSLANLGVDQWVSPLGFVVREGLIVAKTNSTGSGVTSVTGGQGINVTGTTTPTVAVSTPVYAGSMMNLSGLN